MEQVQSQEYRPPIPSGVKIVAWMMLMYILIGLIYFAVLTLTAHRGEVMFRYFGHDYLVSGMLSRAFGIALLVVTFGAMVVSVVCTLRGRMWAYYLLVAGNIPSAVSIILDAIHGRFDVMGWVPLTVAWVLIKDLSAFREYSRSRARKGV
jgi:hypothetical protein